LYLLDEIEASLDATSRDVLIKLIKAENKKWKTFIIVSHSKDILELASRWILLCNWVVDKTWENSKLLKKYFWSCEWCEGENCKN
jgi:ABC-type multidrug transport system ATPase subunit